MGVKGNLDTHILMEILKKMNKKEILLKKAKKIKTQLVAFDNEIDETITDFIINGKDNPKTNKDYDNIVNAKEWTKKSLSRFQLVINNLENQKGYSKNGK